MSDEVVDNVREEDWNWVMGQVRKSGGASSRRRRSGPVKSGKKSGGAAKERAGKSASDFAVIFDRVEKMRGAYGFSQADWEPIDTALTELRSKNEDKNLYLGIVGEFSSGKSTLINALLGAEVLKEDILQGTTCAPTLLQFGERFDIEVRLSTEKVIKCSDEGAETDWKSGSAMCDVQESLRKARGFIDKFTADEEYSKDVLAVTIFLPLKNPLFENNVVIVDTPGINADNPRHQEVAEKAVRDICDTAIVLTQATMPCSMTLVEFVKEHLSGMTNSCICVASQIDLIRRRERDHQLAFIEKKFTTEGARFHRVIGLSAYYAEHPEEKTEDPDARLLRQEFLDAQQYIADALKADRQKVIADKLKHLLSDVLREKVSPLMKDKTNELQERHERLVNNQLYDFDSYVQQAREEYVGKFQPDEAEEEVRRCIGEITDTFKKDVRDAISSSDSKNAVADLFSGPIQEMAEAIQQEKITPLVKETVKLHADQAKEIMKGFHEDFNRAFRDLAGGRKKTISLRGAARKFKADSQFGNFTVSLKTMADSAGAQVGGAAGGAAVGFFVGGPIGAFVGGALGWLGSQLFGPSLAEVKKEAHKSANRMIGNWKSAITKSALQTVVDNATKVRKRIAEAIDSYSQYREYVMEIIENECAEQRELERMISIADGDLDFLANAADDLSCMDKKVAASPSN